MADSVRLGRATPKAVWGWLIANALSLAWISFLLAPFVLGACVHRATLVEAGVSPPSAAAKQSAKFAGISVCAACHAAEFATWQSSAHAHARATLVAANAGSNPDCLPCHVTGMGRPSGWTGPATPFLENVTCEACHGPGGEHAENPQPSRGYGKLPLNAAACSGCHSATNSPDFQFAAHWPLVKHG